MDDIYPAYEALGKYIEENKDRFLSELFDLLLQYIRSDHDPINGHGNDSQNHHEKHFLEKLVLNCEIQQFLLK